MPRLLESVMAFAIACAAAVSVAAAAPPMHVLPAIQYEVLASGDPSGSHPKHSDTVRVNYEVKLMDGKVLESSYTMGKPVDLPQSAVAGAQEVPVPGPSAAEIHDVAAFFKTLPPADNPPLTELRAMTLAAYPLSCIDHLQAQGGGAPDTAAAPAAASGRGGGAGSAVSLGRGSAAAASGAAVEAPPRSTAYLWQPAGPSHLMEGYDKQRAFYGCSDWHSAVNSTWTMVAILRRYPNLPLAKLMREKLNDHLAKRNLEGELAFFQSSPGYERPYGQVWAMKLYNELVTWNDPDAQKWAANLKPLVTLFAAGMIEYLNDWTDAIRIGIYSNTANVMHLMLPYAATTHDVALRAAIDKNARRLYMSDEDCPTGYEPDGVSFLSPCLSEASLMSELLGQKQFEAWFDNFMPPVYAHSFRPLVAPFDATLMKKPQQQAAKSNLQGLEAAKSHLQGLEFSCADAFLAIAKALPAGDQRAQVYRRLAAIHATQGFAELERTGYMGSHWLASYAMMYQLSGVPSTVPAPTAIAASAVGGRR